MRPPTNFILLADLLYIYKKNEDFQCLLQWLVVIRMQPHPDISQVAVGEHLDLVSHLYLYHAVGYD